MSLRIQTNVDALGAHNNLSRVNAHVSKSLERLSSGYRINRGADDAAGLSISERMRGQIKGLAMAQRNIGDGISLVQTAEANLDEVHSMLNRMRELAVQYKNGTQSTANQAAIQTEINQLQSEIERIGSQARFNGISLLNAAVTVSLQVGANDGQQILLNTVSLGASLGTTYFQLSAAGTADISELDAAVEVVSTLRSQFGAVQNRLEHTENAQRVYQENLVAAESRIRDVDMAEEMVELTKYQILTQAATSMLAQANQSSQGVLGLLQ